MVRRKLPKKTSKYKAGRKSVWKDSMILLSYKLALLGATDIQIADVLEVNKNTVAHWKATKPEYAAALKRGKIEADAEIAEAFYRCAKGGFTLKSTRKIWSEKMCTFMEETATREIGPNQFACQKWLSMRQREKWTEVQKLDITNNVNLNITEDLKLEDIDTKELKLIEQLGLRKQLFLKEHNN